MGVVIVVLVVGAAVWFMAQNSQGGISTLAKAIAFAEGGYDLDGTNRNDGSRPSRNHNPGDLTVDINGTGTGQDSGGFVIYPDDATGFAALQAQIDKWLGGTSAHATADSSIADLSQFYTTTDQDAWAANVANAAGVSPDTSIGSI